MIAVCCVKCGRELAEPGALLFSPPGWPFGMVEKDHLCVDCYREVVWFVRGVFPMSDYAS